MHIYKLILIYNETTEVLFGRPGGRSADDGVAGDAVVGTTVGAGELAAAGEGFGVDAGPVLSAGDCGSSAGKSTRCKVRYQQDFQRRPSRTEWVQTMGIGLW